MYMCTCTYVAWRKIHIYLGIVCVCVCVHSASKLPQYWYCVGSINILGWWPKVRQTTQPWIHSSDLSLSSFPTFLTETNIKQSNKQSVKQSMLGKRELDNMCETNFLRNEDRRNGKRTEKAWTNEETCNNKDATKKIYNKNGATKRMQRKKRQWKKRQRKKM